MWEEVGVVFKSIMM